MKNIFAAFVKAQQGFAPALKKNLNPHFKSRYVDLAGCVEAVIDSLNAQGIALIQKTHLDSTGVTVETNFIHESGESMDGGQLHIPASKQDAQGFASALTYCRRLSLMAACGIAPEDDDDGNAAAKATAAAKTAKPHGTITPTDGAGDDLTPQRRSAIEEVALYLVDCHRAGKDMDAIRVWYAADTFESNEERVFAWKLLQAESKLRSAIKANLPKENANV
jgi:hypothetical protein